MKKCITLVALTLCSNTMPCHSARAHLAKTTYSKSSVLHVQYSVDNSIHTSTSSAHTTKSRKDRKTTQHEKLKTASSSEENNEMHCHSRPGEKKILPYLLRMLKSKDLKKQKDAILVLGELNPLPRNVVVRLLKKLRSRSIIVQKAAIWSLSRLTSNNRGVVPAFLHLAKGSGIDLYTHLKNCSTVMIPRYRSELPFLIQALKQKDTRVINVAAILLSRFGKHAIAPLSKAIQHGSSMTRVNALYAVGLLGIQANGMQAILKKRLLAKDSLERMYAAFALGRVESKDPRWVKVISKSLSSSKQDDRYNAAYLISQMGNQAKKAIPEMLKALFDPYGGVRFYALVFLKRHASRGEKRVIAGLKKYVLTEKRTFLRSFAQKLLRSLQ